MTKKQLIAELIVIAAMTVLCVFSAFSVRADSLDDSYDAISTAAENSEPVSNDKVDIVIVKEDDRLPSAINITVGLGLICGAAAVCAMCVKTLRKEKY